jgi:hypothetical protein
VYSLIAGRADRIGGGNWNQGNGEQDLRQKARPSGPINPVPRKCAARIVRRLDEVAIGSYRS